MDNSNRSLSSLIAAFSVALLSASFVFLNARSALSQPDRGEIYGRVADQSGAVLPESKIELTSIDAGYKSEAESDKEGRYSILNVLPGRYRMLASRKGFKTAEKKSITVRIAGSVRLDVTLSAGPANEVVEVFADQASLESDSISLSTLVLRDAARDLPLTISSGRHIEDFAYALSPAVEGDSWTSHIAGAPSFTKEVLIDGLSATSQIQGNVYESSPTMESIQEFRVQTGALSAEYGHAGGGLFNFALKRGTNDFHGSAYYLGRNEALNANSWMSNLQLAQHPDNADYWRARDRQEIAGLSAGGPVDIPGVYNGRNRSFVFGTFERYAQQDNKIGSYDRTVPIPAFLEGDFSSLLNLSDVLGTMPGHPDQTLYAGQIFDPKTMRMVNGQWVADPFPGNIIRKERMSAVSQRVIDIYKKEYLPEIAGRITNNSAGSFDNSPWFHQNQLTLRGDHLVSSAFKLSGSLIWTERPRILLDQGGIWDPSAGQGAGGPLARSRNQNVTSRALRLSADWTANPNAIVTASFAYNRYRNSSLSTQADGNWNEYLGLQNSTNAGLFPQISFGPAVNGNSTTDIGYGSSEYSAANNYIASGALYLTKGRHNIKLGGEFWAQQMNSHAGQDVLSFSFSQAQTGIPGQWANRLGFGFASFFLGEAESGSKNVPFDLYGRREYVALYYQDDYRITDSLTLNLGLRWEQTQPYHEKNGNWANFNPSIVNTNYGLNGALEFAQSGANSFEKKKDWKEFGPRVGAAYRIGSKAVVRAGYGLTYIPLGMNYWSGVPYGFAPGYRGVNEQTKSSTLPLFNWDNGYPDNYKAPSKDPNAMIWGMVAVDERSLFAGYLHQYNVSAQIDLGREMSLEAAFLGNQGRRLHNGAFKRNQPLRSAYENPSVDPYAWIYDESSAAAAGVKQPYAGFSNYAGVALQPFPHVASETGGSIYFVGSPAGSSSYKSFQLSLTRKAIHGLSFQLSYNLSKATGNSENGFDESWDPYVGIQDVNNLSEAAQTVVSFDQTHIFKGNVSYALPFGKGRSLIANASPLLNSFISGWEISGILRYNSGNPLAVTPDAWRPGWEGSVYADFDPSVDLSRQFSASKFNPNAMSDPANRYFNTAAFSNPKGSTLGNGKRYYSELRGFGYAREDIGIMKKFQVREAASIQLRVEMLNAFNRHKFADPNTDMRDLTTFGNVTKLDAGFFPRTTQFGLRFDW